jgi:hypothetical protein
MSRTEEDIPSRVDITIMRHPTLRTGPASYSEVCDTFRPRLACARRTDSGRERFIDFLVPGPVRRRFVAEHVSEARPACIEHRLRQAGLGESGGVHITDRNIVELPNDARRKFMVKVTADIGDMPLSVITEIPNVVTGARLPVEQYRQRLDAVSIDQQHRGKLMRLRDLDKTPNLAETLTFTRKPHPQERHFLPGSSAGVSVPENG